MPLKTMLDAIVRDKGKDEMPDQTPARDNLPSDFGSMVRAIGPKLKLDKENAKPDKSLAVSRDTAQPDENKDIPDAPAQGIFGQAILAFEQLLDRQQHENGEQPQSVTKARTSSKADLVAEPMQFVEADQESEKPAEISVPDKKPGKTDLKAVADMQASRCVAGQTGTRQISLASRAGRCASDPDP